MPGQQQPGFWLGARPVPPPYIITLRFFPPGCGHVGNALRVVQAQRHVHNLFSEVSCHAGKGRDPGPFGVPGRFQKTRSISGSKWFNQK